MATQPPKAGAAGTTLVDQWTGFLQQMQTDQDLQMAVLQFGTQMLQGQGQGGAGFVSDLGQAFGSSQQFLQQRRAQSAQAAKDEEDRQRRIKQEEANLEKTKGEVAAQPGRQALTAAQTEFTTARAANVGKEPARAPTSLERRAAALMNTDPDITTMDQAIVALEKPATKASDKKKFIDKQFEQAAGIGLPVEKIQEDAIGAWNARLKVLHGVDENDVRAAFPEATAEQIEAFFEDPELVEELKALLAQQQ